MYRANGQLDDVSRTTQVCRARRANHNCAALVSVHRMAVEHVSFGPVASVWSGVLTDDCSRVASALGARACGTGILARAHGLCFLNFACRSHADYYSKN